MDWIQCRRSGSRTLRFDLCPLTIDREGLLCRIHSRFGAKFSGGDGDGDPKICIFPGTTSNMSPGIPDNGAMGIVLERAKR